MPRTPTTATAMAAGHRRRPAANHALATRRRGGVRGATLLLTALLVTLLPNLLAAAWPSAGSAWAGTGCPAAEAVAPGVFMLRGSGGVPTPENGGKVANRVFLVGPTGVVVIDPGPTGEAAAELRCTIARHSGRPVVAVVNTHPHPENVLANAAFADLPIFAASEAIEAMRTRCRHCRAELLARIGSASHGDDPDAAILLPDQAVDRRLRVAPGGREIELIPLGAAHSPGDLAILDRDSGVLIAGDVGNALPELRDGSVPAWIAALATLRALPAVRRVIPGRGPAYAPAALAGPADYLATLWRVARERLDSPDGFVPPASLPDALASFIGEPAQHQLNLQHALREAEQAWWQRP
jgi:glyoxylase-like metal-dependent hydrolase (beta-lactamase superfamily II)